MKSQNHHAAFYLCAGILLFVLVLAATTTPASAICEYGSCPWGVDECHYLTGCFQEGSKFYLRQASCDADKCCQYSEREVKCCPEYCDKMSTPTKSYYCDYDVGCVEISYLKECPSGCCCLPGGEYKEQNGLPGLECCMERSSPHIGVCKQSCEGLPPVSPEEGVPGFKAVFAIAGLLAVAYLLRRKK